MNLISDILKKAWFCRAFEKKLFTLIEQKKFKFPLYLSAGQELIPATFSCLFDSKPAIFGQHRGSASIQSKEINMFGHDGLMGSQVPIATGYALSSKNFTISITGDASAEEDYVLSSIAWATKKKVPIIFIVEDNDLSILTEKKVRRDWEMVDFAKSVGCEAFECTDDPRDIEESFLKMKSMPCLFNVKTNRLWWHAGAGIDEEKEDTLKNITKELGLEELEEIAETKNEVLWKKFL